MFVFPTNVGQNVMKATSAQPGWQTSPGDPHLRKTGLKYMRYYDDESGWGSIHMQNLHPAKALKEEHE